MNKKVIDIFLKIVRIASESGNEKEMSQFIKKWAHSNNFIIKEDRVGNMLLKNKGKKQSYYYALI